MKNYLELIKKMETLAAKTTKGPWEAEAKLIAVSREAVPELCEAVRELEAENARLRDDLSRATDCLNQTNTHKFRR